jgi:hypothetical protein
MHESSFRWKIAVDVMSPEPAASHREDAPAQQRGGSDTMLLERTDIINAVSGRNRTGIGKNRLLSSKDEKAAPEPSCPRTPALGALRSLL